MVIDIDLRQIAELTVLPTGQVLWRIVFWYFGWLPVAIGFLWGALELWQFVRQNQWAEKNGQMILLAIDIPQANAQSPRAVENLFAYLHGAHKNPNLLEKWWDGYYQLNFSLEIVSIEGYIQFLISTPKQFKALVETAVYSQYPDAEITQVADYADALPDSFPDAEYDMYGTELLQIFPSALPIKLYQEFEHQFGAPETHYRDPMASLMDLMSSLGKGEQLWFQIIIKPGDSEWISSSNKEVGRIMGEIKPAPKLLPLITGHLVDIWDAAMGKELVKKEEKAPLKMMDLKPDAKRKIELIQNKASKLSFDVKMRVIYIAKKEVMNKPKVVNGFFGFLKQFHSNDSNGFKPDSAKTGTTTAYFQADKRSNVRKGRLMTAYKARSAWRGRLPYVMTVDELATMWHFPIEEVVKAPLVQKSASRRVEPPMRLPVGVSQPTVNYEAIFGDDFIEEKNIQTKQSDSAFINFLTDDDAEKKQAKDQPPDNLPFA